MKQLKHPLFHSCCCHCVKDFCLRQLSNLSSVPQDYPDGIGPDIKPKKRTEEAESQALREPFELDVFRSKCPSAFAPSPDDPVVENEAPKNKFASSSNEQDKEELDLFDVFDPTLSPYACPNGIPSTKRKKQMTVGIILKDHGSRNEASHQRLHDLARLWQCSLGDSGPNKVIVKAAHMEIASPSIPEVLQTMVEEFEVHEIVCHPYFLSPGRHVTEDLPEIIDGSVESLGIEITVTTTPQLGSNTDLMFSAIHSLVGETSALLNQTES